MAKKGRKIKAFEKTTAFYYVLTEIFWELLNLVRVSEICRMTFLKKDSIDGDQKVGQIFDLGYKLALLYSIYFFAILKPKEYN